MERTPLQRMLMMTKEKKYVRRRDAPCYRKPFAFTLIVKRFTFPRVGSFKTNSKIYISRKPALYIHFIKSLLSIISAQDII